MIIGVKPLVFDDEKMGLDRPSSLPNSSQDPLSALSTGPVLGCVQLLPSFTMNPAKPV